MDTFRNKVIEQQSSTQYKVFAVAKYLNETLERDMGLLINQRDARYTREDWEKKQNIVRETKYCADLMMEIFGETNHGDSLRYRDWGKIYFWTLEICKHICGIVCRLCIHVTIRFSSRHIDFCTSIGKISHAFNQMLQTLKLTTTKVLSIHANSFLAETIEYSFCKIHFIIIKL